MPGDDAARTVTAASAAATAAAIAVVVGLRNKVGRGKDQCKSYFSRLTEQPKAAM